MRHPTHVLLALSLLPASLAVAAGNARSLTIFLNPPVVTGGLSAIATVTLQSPAPPEGATVRLNASKATNTNEPAGIATVPPQILIAGRATKATFPIETVPVAAAVTVSISASTGDSQTAIQLEVVPPSVSRLQLNAQSVKGGLPIAGTIELTGPAPEPGFNVDLASSNGSVAKVETTMKVPAGQSAAAFTVDTTRVPAATDVTIAAYSPLVTKTVPLRVLP